MWSLLSLLLPFFALVLIGWAAAAVGCCRWRASVP